MSVACQATGTSVSQVKKPAFIYSNCRRDVKKLKAARDGDAMKSSDEVCGGDLRSAWEAMFDLSRPSDMFLEHVGKGMYADQIKLWFSFLIETNSFS